MKESANQYEKYTFRSKDCYFRTLLKKKLKSCCCVWLQHLQPAPVRILCKHDFSFVCARNSRALTNAKKHKQQGSNIVYENIVVHFSAKTLYQVQYSTLYLSTGAARRRTLNKQRFSLFRENAARCSGTLSSLTVFAQKLSR